MKRNISFLSYEDDAEELLGDLDVEDETVSVSSELSENRKEKYYRNGASYKANQSSFADLILACRDGDIEKATKEVHFLKENNFDIDALDKNSRMSPLMTACQYLNKNIVEMLLKNGAKHDKCAGVDNDLFSVARKIFNPKESREMLDCIVTTVTNGLISQNKNCDEVAELVVRNKIFDRLSSNVQKFLYDATSDKFIFDATPKSIMAIRADEKANRVDEKAKRIRFSTEEGAIK